MSAFTTRSSLFIMMLTVLSQTSAEDYDLHISRATITLINGTYTGEINPQNGTNETTFIFSFATRDLVNRTTKFRLLNRNSSFARQCSPKNDCTIEDLGVWLTRDRPADSSEFQIIITRDQKKRPKKSSICFARGNCSTFTQLKENKTYSTCNNTCLDPSTVCNTAEYGPCATNDSNDDTISIGQSLKCLKCGSPVQKPEIKVDLKNLNISFAFGNMNTAGGRNTTASQMINTITDSVLEQMGDKSTASMSLGDVEGIVMKPKEYSAVSFVYSKETNLSIIEDETQLSTFKRSFSLPKEVFEMSSKQRNGTVFAAMLRFPTFQNDEKNSTLLNGEVYSIEMGTEIASLSSTVNLTFQDVVQKKQNLTCLSWSGKDVQPNWTDEGCSTYYDGTGVICACSHLTFFALLMTPNPDTLSSTDITNLTYITSIGCGLSIFFLSVGLFMHFLLRKARASALVHILINLMVALFLLNLTFLTNEYVANSGSVAGCRLMAGLMHYCMLSSFTWFGLGALHLCLQLAQKSTNIRHYIIKIAIAGWVPPALVVAVIFCMGKYGLESIKSSDGTVSNMCWIVDSTVHYVVNIGYYSLIFLFTFTTFIIILRWLCLLKPVPANNGGKEKTGSGSDTGATETGTSDIVTIMGLCCVLGLTWGFAFFAYGALRIPAFYIFTILNSFQGFFLFIYYYKSSRYVGKAQTTQSEKSSTDVTAVENPYEKPKIF